MGVIATMNGNNASSEHCWHVKEAGVFVCCACQEEFFTPAPCAARPPYLPLPRPYDERDSTHTREEHDGTS